MEIKTGLWKKESKTGTIYYSGKAYIEGRPAKITLFDNENKKSEKSPDRNLIIEFTDERIEEEIKNETPKQEIEVKEDFNTPDWEVIKDEDLPF